MGNLLKLEFRKLASSKVLYICLAIAVVLTLLTAGLLKATGAMFEVIIGDAEGEPAEEFAGEFTDILGMPRDGLDYLLQAITQTDFLLVVAVFVAIFAASDFVNNTMKNILSRGYGRTEAVLSKFVVCVAAVTGMLLCCWIAALAIGIPLFGAPDSAAASDAMMAMILQWLSVMAMTTIFFFLITVTRKLGLAIALGLVAPNVVTLILSLVDVLTQMDVSFQFSSFWPAGTIAELFALPLSTGTMLCAIVTPLVYILLFGGGTLLLTRKQEF